MTKHDFVSYIESSIKQNWLLPAYSDFGGSTKTYGEFGREILLLHQIFKDNKIRKGDKIALIGKNSANWATVYISVVTYGAVIVPILPDFMPENIHHIVNHSDSILFFSADSVFEKLEPEKMPRLQAIFSLTDFSILFAKSEKIKEDITKTREQFGRPGKEINQKTFTLVHPLQDDLAAIVYTSGTTGFSKGVMLTHRSFLSNLIYARDSMPLNPGDTILSFLPLAHALAGAFELIFPTTMGCHITFLDKTPSPNILLRAFHEVRPRLVFMVPLILEKIYKKQIRPQIDRKSVKLVLKLPGTHKLIYRKINQKLTEFLGGNFLEVVVGGAALNHEVEKFLQTIGFPFTVGYGMTECGPLISYSPHDTFKLNSVGKTVDRMEVKINSDDPVSIVGEIFTRGDNVMTGYYKNEVATGEAIDKEGWLHTGDLGLMDEDGFIYIKGRSKNVIIGPSGQNIYPEEIESLLNNMPYIQESLVIESDDKLYALAYPDMDAADQEHLSEEQLLEKMKENLKLINKDLPSFMKLSEIRLYPEEFEKTPTQKIKRFLYALPTVNV